MVYFFKSPFNSIDRQPTKEKCGWHKKVANKRCISQQKVIYTTTTQHRARKKNFKKQGNLLLACSTRLQRCKSPLSKSSAKWVALVILVKSPGNMKVVEWQYSPFDLLGCVKLPFWYGHCSWNHHKQNSTFKWRWLPQKIIANNSFLKFEALFKHHMLWATCTIVLFLAIGNEVLAALVFVSAMLAAIQEL